VRNPAWIIDSIESLIRRNAFDLSGIFSFDASGTVQEAAEDGKPRHLPQIS
jgi:sulfotransferase